MNGNCLIAQSGGPTAVINSSLVGIIEGLIDVSFNKKIYGSVGGLYGLVKSKFISLSNLSQKERYMLRWTPGAALGTWRYKLSTDDLEKILDNFKKYDIRYFFYIGGNGSMYVAEKIHEYAKAVGYELIVVGIPNSVDNDLLGTDHSPGYGSTAKFLATSIVDVNMDMGSYPESKGVTIIETMGRNTGWLAAACSLAEDLIGIRSRLLIFIPESPFDLEECYEKVMDAKRENLNTILVVSEGIRNTKGKLINDNNEFDPLGRPKLGGVSSFLKEKIEVNTGVKSRYVTPSVWQRSNMALASKTDLDEAYGLGKNAVSLILDEVSGYMVCLQRELYTKKYKINFDKIELKSVAGKEFTVPLSWYDQKNNIMTEQYKNYAMPIIQGEMVLPMNNGLPIYKRVI